jgi:hypothetical protein
MHKVVAAEHHRLLSELLDILKAANFVTSDASGRYRLTENALNPSIQFGLGSIASDKAKLETETVPDLAANVVLVWSCMQALPEILRGQVKVPDVMFPGGSPHLVEPIYKNPRLSAPFNQQLTSAVRAYVEDRLHVSSHCIME